MHGYRLRLYPTEEQKKLIDRYLELYRAVYNWGVEMQEARYEEKKTGKVRRGTYTAYDLGVLFTKYRNTPGNEWVKELPKETCKAALRDVYHAYDSFFKHATNYPKFKAKKNSYQTFKTRYDRFYIDGDCVRFEGLKRDGVGRKSIVDTVRIGFDTGFSRKDGTKYCQPSISKDYFGNYWVSFSIEEPKIELDIPQSEPIGIDVGIRQTMVLSTGEIFIRPNDRIKKYDKKLRKAHDHMMRDIQTRKRKSERTRIKYEDIPVSKRAQKRVDRVRKLYRKISNIKNDFYHKTIKEIVTRNPQAVVIETLKTRHMQAQAKKASKEYRSALHRADFFTMHKLIEEKCNRYGIMVIKADENYPSSQICSNCGHIHKIYGKHIYVCPNCGMRLDRDINAALNLRNLYIQ